MRSLFRSAHVVLIGLFVSAPFYTGLVFWTGIIRSDATKDNVRTNGELAWVFLWWATMWAFVAGAIALLLTRRHPQRASIIIVSVAVSFMIHLVVASLLGLS